MRLLIPALLALTFVGCSCQRHGDNDADADAAAQPPPAATPAGPTAAELRAQTLERQRTEAYT
ncbi:MAG: hypothetical protein ACREP7_11075, partial [Lysobacter sp.]